MQLAYTYDYSFILMTSNPTVVLISLISNRISFIELMISETLLKFDSTI